MTDPRTPLTSSETLAQRKQQLRQQCQAYRAGIGLSRISVSNNLGMESLAQTALGLVSLRAQSMFNQASELFDLRHLSGDKLKRILPVLVSAYSLLSRKSLLKPILRGALIVGVAGTVGYFYVRRKSVQPESDHVARHEHL